MAVNSRMLAHLRITLIWWKFNRHGESGHAGNGIWHLPRGEFLSITMLFNNRGSGGAVFFTGDIELRCTVRILRNDHFDVFWNSCEIERSYPTQYTVLNIHYAGLPQQQIRL